MLSLEGEISLYCHECGSTDLRVSRLHLRDYAQLIMMKYPIRCRTCKTRSFAPLRLAFQLPRLHRSGTRRRSAL